MQQIRAVLFDVYGTLVEIQRPKRPFRKLVDFALDAGAPMTRKQAAHEIMAHCCDLPSAAKRLGVDVPPEQLAQWQSMLDDELASITPFPETETVLARLRAHGYRIGVCSNLALPYVFPVLERIGGHVDHATWSCFVGSLKPDPLIFARAVRGLGLLSSQVLMVGDTYADDVAGAARAGLQALWLERTGPNKRTLEAVAEMLT